MFYAWIRAHSIFFFYCQILCQIPFQHKVPSVSVMYLFGLASEAKDVNGSSIFWKDYSILFSLELENKNTMKLHLHDI